MDAVLVGAARQMDFVSQLAGLVLALAQRCGAKEEPFDLDRFGFDRFGASGVVHHSNQNDRRSLRPFPNASEYQ